MTITLELQPETEASLLAQARARGLSLEAYLRSIIVGQAASAMTASAPPELPGDGKIRIVPSTNFSIRWRCLRESDRAPCVVRTGIGDRRRHERPGRRYSNI